MVVYWNLIWGVVEFASQLVMLNMFLLEEVTQSGCMACYLATGKVRQAPVTPLVNLTRIHGIEPGMMITQQDSWICPWCTDAFTLFFKAGEGNMRCYDVYNASKDNS